MRIIEQKNLPGLATLYLAQFRKGPDHLVELVDTLEPGVPKALKWVMMISTQFGCPVGCRMCDAGAMGYQGNLDPEEILAQIEYIIRANRDLDVRRHPKVKIHFARMGEPSLNPNVLEALRSLAREFPYPGILPSLSTVAPKSPAVAPFFEELVDIKNALFPDGRFQLQFSLHSLSEEKRKEIVPIKKWDLDEVAAYGKKFWRTGDRKITLNFALAQGETLDAKRLAGIFPPDKFLVKITPINPTETADLHAATHLWTQPPDSIKASSREIESRGFETILSPSLPEEIDAETSCGQLWSRKLKDAAAVALENKRREAASYVTQDDLGEKSDAWMAALAGFQRRAIPLSVPKAGLLAIDLQGLFLDARSPAYLPPARAILPNVRRLVEAFRDAGRPVYFTRHAHVDPEEDGGLMTLWWRTACLEGTREARITHFLEPRPGEVFRKCRYSALTNPSLRKALRRDGVEELVIAGVATNLCVESTVRGAFDLGLKSFVIVDATAAHAEELHLAALKNMAFGFASLCRTDIILDSLNHTGSHRVRETALQA
ncbi:MAG: isochorismatase family protein [Elusimicrobia bacterium]|nr:isochorismatase family protein [Elusimicrobiota bacterium]